mmetsp:Transcript_45564/g.143108  ORF Transcript_45564/g.143108 Transcript_45564/m.143108 type:complete len:87 (-) Transcript_45564:102-362(-)
MLIIGLLAMTMNPKSLNKCHIGVKHLCSQRSFQALTNKNFPSETVLMLRVQRGQKRSDLNGLRRMYKSLLVYCHIAKLATEMSTLF